MDFSGNKVWAIVIALAIIVASVGYALFFMPAQENNVTTAVSEENSFLPEKFSSKIFLQGNIIEGISECGDYYCFKLNVLSSDRKDLVNKDIQIKTNMPIELNAESTYTVYAEEKEGMFYADWFDIGNDFAFEYLEGM